MLLSTLEVRLETETSWREAYRGYYASGSPQAVPGLVAGKLYHFRVSLESPAGASEPSEAEAHVIGDPPGLAPRARIQLTGPDTGWISWDVTNRGPLRDRVVRGKSMITVTVTPEGHPAKQISHTVPYTENRYRLHGLVTGSAHLSLIHI